MADHDPGANLPAPLGRAALERVLARAAELQGAAADGPEGALTEAQLLEVGREVGIDAAHLRQALAEERTRVTLPEEPGLVGRFAGPAVASATRVVNGTPVAVLDTLDGWMQREECLQVKRRYPGRMTWERRRDFVGNIKRSLRMGGRGYDLTRAGEVGATVVAVDERRSLVRSGSWARWRTRRCSPSSRWRSCRPSWASASGWPWPGHIAGPPPVRSWRSSRCWTAWSMARCGAPRRCSTW
jgi:hypothetical protein